MNSCWRSFASMIGLFALVSCTPGAPSQGAASVATSAPATSTPAATAAPATSGTPPRQPTPRPAVANGTLKIELFEWSISPEPFELPPGTYKAEVVNMGRRQHDLVVAASDSEVQTRRLNPGQTQVITFVLKPGETTMWCSIGDHRDMGMEAYVQVD